jgi:hypothetical protein
MERTLTFNTNFYSELYLYTTCSRDILCVRRRPSRLGRRIETGGAQVALLWHRFRGYSGHFPGLFFCTELWLWFDFAKGFFFYFFTWLMWRSALRIDPGRNGLNKLLFGGDSFYFSRKSFHHSRDGADSEGFLRQLHKIAILWKKKKGRKENRSTCFIPPGKKAKRAQ